MFHRLAMPLLLCVLLSLSAGGQDKPNASTPKGAAALFFQAMESGDIAAAKEMAVGNARQMAVLDALVPVVSGFKKLEAAAAKKWGEEGRKTLITGQDGPGSFDFKEQLKTAREEIVEDSATITPVNAKDAKRDTMKLKRIDGKWKLDLASIPTDGLENQATQKMLRTMAQIATSLAGEIDQDKYASATDAREALRRRMFDEESKK